MGRCRWLKWLFPVLLGLSVHTYLAVHDVRAQTETWNENEWHIDGLPGQHVAVQCFNALCGARCSAVILAILERTLVRPALDTSLQAMQLAEASGDVDEILCGAGAREAMKQRLNEYHSDLQTSQSLSSFAKVTLYAAALNNLGNHAALIALAPAAHVEKVVAPVFIVSLPRTCTTILHRTMAQDRQRWRNFDMCDMLRPVPPIARGDVQGREVCAEEVGEELALMDVLYPGLRTALESMHGFYPAEADEDLGWYDNGLGHLYMDILMLTYPNQRAKPGGMSPLESKAVARYRYAFLHLVMQIYQSVERDSTERPWLMKDPNHAAYLPELLAQFPDAKLIFSHRAPKEIVASLAKLFVVFASTQHVAGASGTSAREWGTEAVRRLDGYVQGLLTFSQHQDGAFSGNSTQRIDFNFNNLVKDVPAAIQEIYARFYPDMPGPTPEALTAFAAYLDRNARHRKGRQNRSLEDFHITADDISLWTDYETLFGL